MLVALQQRRALDALEHEHDVVRQSRDRADRGRRVEPVPDPAAPQQHARVRGHQHAAQHRLRARRRRLRPDPERHDREAVERVGLQRLPPRQDAEPEVALALARAEREVGRRQMRRRGAPDDAVQPRPRRRRLRARGLDRLDHGRVVEVDHEPGRLLPDPPEQARREQLGDDDVVLADGADQRVVVHQPGLQQPQPGGLPRQRAPRGRGERDRRVGGERAGELVGADRRPGHTSADRFCGDDEDARRRQVEQYGRLERRPTRRACRRGAARDRARPAARRVGVRQPAGRRAGRTGALRAGARRGQPRARRRDLPAHAGAAEGVRRAARRARAARRRPRDGAVGGEADAHVRRPRGAERVRVRLQRPEADGVRRLRREAQRAAARSDCPPTRAPIRRGPTSSRAARCGWRRNPTPRCAPAGS